MAKTKNVKRKGFSKKAVAHVRETMGLMAEAAMLQAGVNQLPSRSLRTIRTTPVGVHTNYIFEYVYTRDLKPYTTSRPFDPKNRGRLCGVVVAKMPEAVGGIVLPVFFLDGSKCKGNDKFDPVRGLQMAIKRVNKQIAHYRMTPTAARLDWLPCSLQAPIERMGARALRYFKCGLAQRPQFKSFKPVLKFKSFNPVTEK